MKYKGMFEQLTRKAKTLWEEYQAEIAVALSESTEVDLLRKYVML